MTEKLHDIVIEKAGSQIVGIKVDGARLTARAVSIEAKQNQTAVNVGIVFRSLEMVDVGEPQQEPTTDTWVCNECGQEWLSSQSECDCQESAEMTHTQCLEWVQAIIAEMEGESGTIDDWAEATSRTFTGRPPGNPLEAWFYGSIRVGILGLHAISGYDGEVEVNLDKALDIMDAYYTYHSEDNAIGPLMMAIAMVVEEAAMAVRQGYESSVEKAKENKATWDALGAIIAQCKAWKKAACAIGTPAVVPSAPASGGGTGPSMPGRP